jgi:hypothetical protein
VLGAGSGEGSLGAPARVRGHRGRALQEDGGLREPASRLRTPRTALKLRGELLVRALRSRGLMQEVPIRILVRIDHLSKCLMDLPALLRRCVAVHRGAGQRVPEPHARPKLEQACGRGRGPRSQTDSEPLGGAPYEHQVSQRLGRRNQ